MTKQLIAENYYTRCMDCGKFIPRSLWIKKDHPTYKGAECSECLSNYDGEFNE